MFSNVDNNLGINAITNALNSREVKFPSTECIVEELKFVLRTTIRNFKKEIICKFMALQWATKMLAVIPI